MAKVIRIERTKPREGVLEEPVRQAGSYVLGDPKCGAEKHHADNAVFVATLEEAAALVEKGFSLRMGRPGKRGSLISPGSLRIIRA